MKILILCTGNSCRSQMAEGFLRSLDPGLSIFSAGTRPAPAVHPMAVDVMREIGVDLAGARPKHAAQFLDEAFDYVITVCGEADRECPAFSGRVGRRLHIGFDDPAAFIGTGAEVLAGFRRVRDEIVERFREFHRRELTSPSAGRSGGAGA